MIDLMSCQMCGGEACGQNDGNSTWVQCSDCNVSSGDEFCGEHNGGLSDEEISDFEDAHDLLSPADVAAAKGWNQMQAWIARGKLLDEAPKSKGGRL